MFKKLTAFIPKIQRGVNSRIESSFEEIFFYFMEDHPELEPESYPNTVKNADTENVSGLNAVEILALIHYILNTDRICEGLLRRSMED